MKIIGLFKGLTGVDDQAALHVVLILSTPGLHVQLKLQEELPRYPAPPSEHIRRWVPVKSCQQRYHPSITHGS